MNQGMEQGPRNSLWLRTAALVAAGTALVGLAACGDDETTLSGGPDAAVTTTVELNPDQEIVAAELCGEEGIQNRMSMRNEFDLSKVGSTDALLPSFRTVENGETVDATPEEVVNTLLELSCVEPDLAAVVDALWLQTTGYGGTGTFRKLDASIFGAIEERSDLFRQNKPEMLETVENIASVITAPGGLVEVNNYNVIIGEAKIVTTERDENGNAVQLVTKDVTTEGLFEGYQLRFNFEGTDFSEEQKQRMLDIGELILITKDGEIIVKKWIGPDGQTSFDEDDQSEDTVPVDTVIDESDTTINQSGTTTVTTPSGGTTGTTTGGGGTTPGTGTGPGTSGPGTTGGGTPTTAGSTTSSSSSTSTSTPTTQPELFNIDVCDLDAPRNEGGYGVVKFFRNITKAMRDAILADPMNKTPYTSLGDSNNDGQVICK